MTQARNIIFFHADFCIIYISTRSLKITKLVFGPLKLPGPPPGPPPSECSEHHIPDYTHISECSKHHITDYTHISECSEHHIPDHTLPSLLPSQLFQLLARHDGQQDIPFFSGNIRFTWPSLVIFSFVWYFDLSNYKGPIYSHFLRIFLLNIKSKLL